MCRSRRELSNAYLLEKFGFDTAENEPSEVCPGANGLADAVPDPLRRVSVGRLLEAGSRAVHLLRGEAVGRIEPPRTAALRAGGSAPDC